MSGDEDTGETPLSRRTVLLLLGGTVALGTVVSTDDEKAPDFSGEESELQYIAGIIDSTDLRNPLNNSMLRSSIDTALKSVNSSLTDKGIDPTGKTVSSTSSVGADNIKQALRYYQELQQTLAEAGSLSEKVESREIASMYTEYFDGKSKQETHLPDIDSSLSRFSKTVSTRTFSDIPTSTQQLLPDQSRVNSQLNQQRAVYKKHADMQGRFPSVISSINSGIDDFEHSSFDSAARSFQQAKNKASVQVSDSLKDYKVTSYSLSLGDYSNIFRLYRRAAGNMAAGCAEGLNRKERNQKIDLGIRKQFKARSLFADRD
ncbi:hypothetical protein [Haloarcula argentinensis]|uniref:Uncharacterized protein n=1 Tax=Haloarcula argentinensis TaxID=43776 RepID=A0A830FN16_HALAR|nr:hypothetical protein [Haloarcula argentinensis]GGM40062.1 hypothetical protein GCM10009006_21460 [Haloarcula argentinensis]